MLVPMLLQSDAKNAGMSFRDDLQASYAPQSCMGSSTPTFTRASVKTVQEGVDGNVSSLLSDEWPSTGARRVRNWMAGSENSATWSTINATITTGVADPIGGTSAFTITATNNNGEVYGTTSLSILTSDQIILSTWIRRRTGTGNVSLLPNGSSGTVVALTGSWQRMVSAVFTGAGTINFDIKLVTNGDAIDIWHPQPEVVSGRSNQAPSEYVSVGVASAPAYHGTGVDGVKLFDTLNGNTVAENVVTEATGAKIATGSSNWAALPGTSGNYFSTPSAAANQITGDIDLRILAAPTSWTSGVTQEFISKLITAGQYAYDFYINSGTLALRTSPNGTTLRSAYSSVNVSTLSLGSTKYGFRVTRSASTGDVTFYSSPDFVTWNIFGAVQSTTIEGIKAGTDAVAIGASGGTGSSLTGHIYRAQIYNVIGGTTPVVDFNPNSYVSGSTWPSATGETWTINGSASVFTGAGLWDAKGPLGYLAEQASDQRVTPTAAIRDMTDASWVKVGITAALDAVGADGIANSATTLTAAGAVTNTILQTLVAAASSRTYSIKLKRGVGTGTIKLTQDGGVTLSADMSSLLNTNTFTVVQWNANVLNAAFGLVMGTQNDTVIADMNLFEPGAVATSRILTAGATRNVDVDQYVSALNWNAAAFTAAGEVTWPVIPPTGNYWLIGTYVDANNATGVLWDGTNLVGRVRIGGTSHDATKAFAPVAGTTYKWAMTHDATGTQIYINGVAGTSDATGTAAQIGTNLQVGSDGNGAYQPDAYVRLDRSYSKALTAAQIGNIP